MTEGLRLQLIELLEKYIDRAEGYLEEYIDQGQTFKAHSCLEAIIKFRVKHVYQKHCEDEPVYNIMGRQLGESSKG
jgi:hypothetical protein